MRINLTKFIVLEKSTINFLKKDGYMAEEVEYAEKFNSIDDALGELDKCDTPADFEIRKLNISLEVAEVVK